MEPSRQLASAVLERVCRDGPDATQAWLTDAIAAESDTDQRAARRVLLGLLLADRGRFDEAAEQFDALRDEPGWGVWSCLGHALIASRSRRFDDALALLDQADREAGDERDLQAAAAHLRGTVYYHQGGSGRLRQAADLLHFALDQVGDDSPTRGRVLDTLGMVYTAMGNFQAGLGFYQQALLAKLPWDEAGVALTHGNLGRLYLDWGHFEQAAEHFEEDLKIAERTGDARGYAQMCNYLGVTALRLGQVEDAADWLEDAVERAERGGWTILAGYARKDRAAVYLADGDVAAAAADVQAAREQFTAMGFREGLAHVDRVAGLVAARQGDAAGADRAFGSARRCFEDLGEPAEAARVLLEWALAGHTYCGVRRAMTKQHLLDALAHAEHSRRDRLVAEIEDELRRLDPAAHAEHIYRRIRGRDVTVDTVSLFNGARENVTVLFLDLAGSSAYGKVSDVETVMVTLNHMMAELEQVLARHGLTVTAHLGDGFMALARGEHHPRRAAYAALELHEVMDQFNRPRQALGQVPLPARIGIATGEALVGNVGTYRKMDYTAIGHTVNLAARLQTVAEVGKPCVGRETHERLHGLFEVEGPQTVDLKGVGTLEVWFLLGVAGARPGP